MLQFFEWFWVAIGIPEKLHLEEGQVFQGFLDWLYTDLLKQENVTGAMLAFGGAILLCCIIPYLLGSLNAAIIVSKAIFHDDIRTHGSGNAGMTNMGRVFGKKGALLTLAIDSAKQFVAVTIGIVLYGEVGAYFAGVFCMLGHIAPIYYHFRGGKGVLTAGVMILMIDWQVFLIAFVLFALTVLFTRYVSLGSVVAGFSLPAIVYTRANLRGMVPSIPALTFSLFIGMLLIFMHRSNLRRIFEGTENRFSFHRNQK